jgi:hypothetical protein
MSRLICVDFDRVIHSDESSPADWYKPVGNNGDWDATLTPDPPVKDIRTGESSILWMKKILAGNDFNIAIFSCRNTMPGGITAIQGWLLRQGMSVEDIAEIEFPQKKPVAHLYIDDRAFRFEGWFPTIEEMKAMKSWNKKV